MPGDDRTGGLSFDLVDLPPKSSATPTRSPASSASVRDAVPRLEPGPERAAAVLLVPPVLSAGNAPMADLIGRVGDELAASDQVDLIQAWGFGSRRGPGCLT